VAGGVTGAHQLAEALGEVMVEVEVVHLEVSVATQN
jgi:hypothetical protein